MVLVIGLGKTGASCVRYLARRGVPLIATDSRADPPALDAVRAFDSALDVRLGGFDLSALDRASEVVLSPGVSPREPIVREARRRGIPVIGDIELFARAARAPVIAVTGTNGKSTVTSLVAHMAASAGRRVLAGGNLGEPALDLIEQPTPELYVLELSSYQLESTESLAPQAAALLNVSPDHLDRYASIEEYVRAKARILRHAATAVLNADDPRVSALAPLAPGRTLRFSLGPAAGGAAGGAVGGAVAAAAGAVAGAVAEFTLVGRGDADAAWLAVRGRPLLPLSALKIKGLHNAANALAALALGEAAGLSLEAMSSALETFPGLPHRSVLVGEFGGVRYVDDSKGTNVGATLAAVAGFAGPLVLIAGGEGKGQDFSPLASAFRGKVRHLVLIGKDARALEAALRGVSPIEHATTLEDAVAAAARAARPGDTVLLSPACASLDMFRDYAERGEKFAAAVRALGDEVRP
ncbi:MAG TPA: UDP-N-acetylmuramoyl-L-alanine--D-glutamate ligase [Steroidobacteraceae bacterium]|nr:UDP-N-acetylmuramoyl-L-alanine--D-glutamate ligase [Steroidobacteraceae bacterium]